jgi:hypothetical protein
MQTIRLENHDRVLVDQVEIQAHGEPDAVLYMDRVFVRLPMQLKEPPTKNSPEVYVEASTMTVEPAVVHPSGPAPAFDKVTETIPIDRSRDIFQPSIEADPPAEKKHWYGNR